jgi:hypothetical protein
MLSDEQRQALEKMGPSNARLVLSQSGGGLESPISGFPGGEIVRQDVMTWLEGNYAEGEARHAEDQARQDNTLRWAQIAAWISFLGVVVSLATIFLHN